jgi:hypothetical protein
MNAANQNYITLPSSCTFDNQTSINIHVRDNRVYGPGATAMVSGCHKKALSVSDWLKLGMDPGTTIADVPSNEKIMAMGMAVLTAWP